MALSDESISTMAAPVNIDVLPNFQRGEYQGLGVRVRPYGRDYPKEIMVMGYGADFDEALTEAYHLAAEDRWEKLDWAARPWGAASTASTGAFGPPTKAPQRGPAPF